MAVFLVFDDFQIKKPQLFLNCGFSLKLFIKNDDYLV